MENVHTTLEAALGVLNGPDSVDPRSIDVPPGAKLVYCCGNPGCSANEQTHTLLNCTACGAIKYCGKPCQVADWKQHKPECRARRDAAEALASVGVTYQQKRLKSADINIPRLFEEALKSFAQRAAAPSPSSAQAPRPKLGQSTRAAVSDNAETRYWREAWVEAVAGGDAKAVPMPAAHCPLCGKAPKAKRFGTNADVREYVISASCGTCQKAVFG